MVTTQNTNPHSPQESGSPEPVSTHLKRPVCWSLFAVLSCASSLAMALSPPNITTDIPWRDTGGVYASPTPTAALGGVEDIAAAFDNARRNEEYQLGLKPYTLGYLELPPQRMWNKLSFDQKGLLLINAERKARAGMQPNVLGLPFAGVEANIDNVAEGYAQLLYDTNTMDHFQPSGEATLHNPQSRIAANPVIGDTASVIGGQCHEFISQSENLAFFTHYSSVPLKSNPLTLPVSLSIYEWIYADSESHWGHRTALLLQDSDLTHQNPLNGYSNDNGSLAHEGYIGIAVRSGVHYNPFGPHTLPYSLGTVVVLNLFEPLSDTANASAHCRYSTLVTTESLNALCHDLC